MFKNFITALSFLSIVPLRLSSITVKDLQSAVPFFPMVGFLEGCLLSLIVYSLHHLLSPLLLSVLLLLILFLIRGIFHLDGLADTFDALFYKGTGDEESDRLRRLEIMKDSSVGVGGVSAVVLVLLLKLSLFYEIILHNQQLLFLAVFTFSRWLIIPLMRFGRPARSTGLGVIFLGRITERHMVYASIFPTLLLLYLTFQFFPLLPFSLFFCLILVFLLKKVFESRFGGITGDHLGTTVELCEVFFPLIFILFERLWQSI